ncbi:hypothetical protein OIU85_001091 [Salix viminalis]|uniref:Uncharacterized protein n=1 Tax=Salix viminalis TaxID=40686 RepID=A0A9Q0VN19_SALVM|nr:hypothetical protein OIU85_001091 [Salix viminalis]
MEYWCSLELFLLQWHGQTDFSLHILSLFTLLVELLLKLAGLNENDWLTLLSSSISTLKLSLLNDFSYLRDPLSSNVL